MTQKITIAIAFIIMAMAIQSCTKDDTEILTKQNNTNNKSTMREGDNTEAKVLKFIDRMDIVREDPNYNGSEDWNYSKDSAVWYIEAALNYSHSHPLWFYEMKTIDSSYSSIDEGSNGFNIIALQTSFDVVINNLNIQFESIENEHKALLYVDVYGVEDANNDLGIKTKIYWGNGNSELPDGEWYIDGDKGMFFPANYTHGSAKNKIMQDAHKKTYGIGYTRVNVWFSPSHWEMSCVYNKPYTGFVFPGFDNSWLYAETSPWHYNLPHWIFTNTLTSAQISLYTDNLLQLSNLISSDYNETAFDWNVYLQNGKMQNTVELSRWYQTNIKMGVEHTRQLNPITYIQ